MLYFLSLSETHFLFLTHFLSLSLLQLQNQITVSAEIFSFQLSRTFSVSFSSPPHRAKLSDPSIAVICGAFPSFIDRVIPTWPRSFFWCWSVPELTPKLAGAAVRSSEPLSSVWLLRQRRWHRSFCNCAGSISIMMVEVLNLSAGKKIKVLERNFQVLEGFLGGWKDFGLRMGE